jgi:hypothetical protein
MFLPVLVTSSCNRVPKMVNFIAICILPYSSKTSFCIGVKKFMFHICIYVGVMCIVFNNNL